MTLNTSRKTQVDLSCYNYRLDIEHRLLMSDFTSFEVEVLLEVLHGSLRFTVDSLAQLLGASKLAVMAALESLQKTKLLKVAHGQVVVDKERRKYYESQMEKFDNDFEPDVEYVLSTLRQVPIHVLPTWYAISKSTDDIFSSIIEKHLLTPEIYRRYILDLCYDDPIAAGIIEDVFTSPDFKVRGQAIREKYKLSNEQFEERLLHLEFQLACFLSYSQINGEWTEVVTPLHEWRQFLRFQREAYPATIKEAEVHRYRSDDFGFIIDLAALLQASKPAGIPLKKGSLDEAAVKNCLASVADEQALQDPAYAECLMTRALQVGLAEVVDNKFHALPEADPWIKQPPHQRAVILYRCVTRAAERDLRAIEKSLKRMVGAGWITFDDFMAGFTQPIGKAVPMTLVKKGKRWRYQIPSYDEDQKAFIQAVIFQHLFHVGMVATGLWKRKACFKITPFGKFTLGE